MRKIEALTVGISDPLLNNLGSSPELVGLKKEVSDGSTDTGCACATNAS